MNKVFKDDFDFFLSSGCYDHLVKNKWLVPHEEISENFFSSPDWYKTLLPQKISFISFVYEWCVSMIKDAALLTLRIAKEVIPFGMVLKDATPYNVQWLEGKPVFIDTLSFERYDPVMPWIAYRQFCESFLSPLLLIYYTKQPLQSLLLAYPNGIPLSIARSLLPWRSKFSFHTYLHIHLHERLASKSTGKEAPHQINFSEKKLFRLLDSLESLIESLQWRDVTTSWGNYYDEAKERKDYVDQKRKILGEWLGGLPEVKTAVDLGANVGEFSHLLSERDIDTIAADYDHTALNRLHETIKKSNTKNILPLLIDIANPSPSIGMNNAERNSFLERTKVDLALALALVHHLAIGKNIRFEQIAEFLEALANWVIIEFIPKQDEKVQFMLKQKKDIYSGYTEENFLKEFEKFFSIEDRKLMVGSNRVLFLMKKLRHQR